MDELTIGDKIYISSKKAAEITGYAKDYVGQLCREGRVEATLVGRSWYVLEESIREHRFGKEEKEAVLEDLESETAGGSSVSYVSEVPQVLPELSQTAERIEWAPEPTRSDVATGGISGEDGVANMQSVWKEWFDRRSSPEVETEPKQNLAETISAAEKEAEEEERYEEDTNQYQEVYEEPKPEPVPIVRTRPAYQGRAYAYDIVPKTSQIGSFQSEERYVEVEQKQSGEMVAARAKKTEEEGTPSAFSPILLRAVFIGVAILFVSLTVIATGFVSKAQIQNSALSSIVEYLGGTRILNK